VTVPALLVTLTVYVPALEDWTLARLRVALVAPLIAVPLKFHW
jgi:hypothetical protein